MATHILVEYQNCYYKLSLVKIAMSLVPYSDNKKRIVKQRRIVIMVKNKMLLFKIRI